MDNKIKLEDTCLTVEQAKELQALGIDMSDSIMAYCDYYDQVHDYELLVNNSMATSYAYEVVNTLTNTEMMEMLPEKYIYSYEDYFFEISNNSMDEYLVLYKRYWNDITSPRFSNKLLRESLFGMIKYLKTNKLMQPWR